MGCDFVLGAVKPGNLCTLQKFHALFDKSLLGETRNFGVFNRENAIHNLNNRHIRANTFVETGKLNPDGA